MEAAILLPCILFFLMAMIYTAFFFHDILIVHSQLCIMELQGEGAEKDGSVNRQEEEKLKTATRINQRTFVGNLTDIKISDTGSMEEYKGTVEFSIPMQGMREWLEGYVQKKETCKVEGKQYFYCENLRKIKALAEVVSGSK